MKTALTLIILILLNPLGLMSPAALAQDCNSKMAASTPDNRFRNNDDDSVTDTWTGLRWTRCSLGQTWKQGACQEEAQALPFAIVSLVTPTGWRLPEIGELSSLVELRCSRPAINNSLFPNTPADVYWTATRFVNKDGNFWQVHFLHGESTSARVDETGFVRWVRDD